MTEKNQKQYTVAALNAAAKKETVTGSREKRARERKPLTVERRTRLV